MCNFTADHWPPLDCKGESKYATRLLNLSIHLQYIAHLPMCSGITTHALFSRSSQVTRVFAQSESKSIRKWLGHFKRCHWRPATTNRQCQRQKDATFSHYIPLPLSWGEGASVRFAMEPHWTHATHRRMSTIIGTRRIITRSCPGSSLSGLAARDAKSTSSPPAAGSGIHRETPAAYMPGHDDLPPWSTYQRANGRQRQRHCVLNGTCQLTTPAHGLQGLQLT